MLTEFYPHITSERIVTPSERRTLHKIVEIPKLFDRKNEIMTLCRKGNAVRGIGRTLMMREIPKLHDDRWRKIAFSLGDYVTMQ